MIFMTIKAEHPDESAERGSIVSGYVLWITVDVMRSVYGSFVVLNRETSGRHQSQVRSQVGKQDISIVTRES